MGSIPTNPTYGAVAQWQRRLIQVQLSVGSTPIRAIMKIEDILMRNEQLILENEALRLQIEDLKYGFEGSCMACEPVGEMNKKLRDERDNARRMYCKIMSDISRIQKCTPQWFAEEENWDCYKEPYCFRVNGVVVSKGKAVPPKFELGEDDE